ncbi:hypothetical protein RB653_001074 [Dictyostelium firmibasis]|uniref:Pre-mRNA-splicing factor SYF2 n=1 Tax=Dictyostelium firmibasis TaxID=79012 RepID=A0AAN7YWD4_9MYCE
MSEKETIESLKEEIEIHDRNKTNKGYLPKESYNQVTYDYSKEEEQAKLAHLPKKYLKESENGDKHYIDPLENLTPAQRKVYELRKKLETTKGVIYKSVVDEHKRIHQGAQDEIEEKRRLYKEKVKQEEDEMKKQGLDPEKERLKNQIADEIKANKKDKKKDGPTKDRSNTYSDEHIYNSYKKRVKEMEKFHNSEHFKNVVSTKDASESGDSINNNRYEYGKSIEIPRENINAMKQELLKNQELRRNFKRKAFKEEEDINYINEENRIFNQKTSRAYDKYTVETRQNLERGTAL